jgi:hypothetical protein
MSVVDSLISGVTCIHADIEPRDRPITLRYLGAGQIEEQVCCPPLWMG